MCEVGIRLGFGSPVTGRANALTNSPGWYYLGAYPGYLRKQRPGGDYRMYARWGPYRIKWVAGTTGHVCKETIEKHAPRAEKSTSLGALHPPSAANPKGDPILKLGSRENNLHDLHEGHRKCRAPLLLILALLQKYALLRGLLRSQ